KSNPPTSFTHGGYKNWYDDMLQNQPTPEPLRLPEWAGKQTIDGVFFYNAEEIRIEGLPGVLKYFPEHSGYKIIKEDRTRNEWELEQLLSNGSKIHILVTTSKLSDYVKEKGVPPDYIAFLQHSYESDGFFFSDKSFNARNYDWSKSVMLLGSCGSAGLQIKLAEAGYRPQIISNLAIGHGLVNLITSANVLNTLSLDEFNNWEDTKNQVGMDAWGVSYPDTFRARFTDYVINQQN
ncbi:MAG: hypothetical protein ACMG6E_01075, partial [Candidatus Roizmanbacteria bacterium]